MITLKKSIVALLIAPLCFMSCSDDDNMEENTMETVFVSSNTSGKISTFDFEEKENMGGSTINSMATDADGIYYDKSNDVLYQLNRTANVINAYSNFSTNPSMTATSSSDFINGREIAVHGNQLVVAQDANTGNGNTNKFYIYNFSPTSITLEKTLTADINLWGIHLDGSTMYAIEDNSSNLAIYENFFSNSSGMVMPTNKIAIEGIVRTHGITYNSTNDVMILTDVAEAASGEDGAVTWIENFSSMKNNASISSSNQKRIAGSNTFLGNPVDVAYSHKTGLIYVAERKNAGGRFLVFNTNATGNITPSFNMEVAGASAVHLP